MYRTCLFCHADLGSNEVIEHFPLGRRLAFDSAQGRLWVVCSKCKGWNLTPFDERWEAIEECERAFRDTRMRVSTDHIGLAKLREGLELVRIGSPQRPEFAAWRYGERLVLRRRKTIIQVGAGLAIVGGIVAGGLAMGVGVGGFWYGTSNAISTIINGSKRKIIARVDFEGQQAVIRRKHLKRARLITEGDQWALTIPGRTGKGDSGLHTMRLRGQQAFDLATKVLPSINRFGGRESDVQDAVGFLERQPDPRKLFVELSQASGFIPEMKPELRLALEMAAHEDAERRALEGELADLEGAWKEAEEIAAISDNMFLPESVTAWMSRVREKSRPAW